MLSSESFRFMIFDCVGSGSSIATDKRRSGSSKIGMMEEAFRGKDPVDCVVIVLLSDGVDIDNPLCSSIAGRRLVYREVVLRLWSYAKLSLTPFTYVG